MRSYAMTGFSLKDQLFNRHKVLYLAELFAAQNPAFKQRKFVADVMRHLESLELKQRISLIAQCLSDHLPSDFAVAARQIVRSLPPPLDATRTDDDFGDFIFAPLGEYVVRHGSDRALLHVSLQTLKEITQRFSMEDAVRAFVRQFPDETLRELTQWARDSHYHVRRVVSESTRPLLPWSARIGLPVEMALPLLDALHADPTRYVTRSVANHLNDIAKSDPELVLSTLRRWQTQALQNHDELMWMTRHALRTLIKSGHTDALKLLGYRAAPKITVGQLRLSQSQLAIGETLAFSVDITAQRDETLVVDYVIDFAKAGGKRSRKVFKAAKLKLNKGESHTIRKQHKLLAQATTYRLYPGEHRLTLQVNGNAMESVDFTIV